MSKSLQLPSLNALVSADRDVLRQIFQVLVSEVNELRREVDALRSETNRSKGY